MKQKALNILQKTLILILCLSSICLSIASIIPIALARGSDGILGTNKALGSPILNNDFQIEDWNKWEIICWGVFLSNFCQPLIDSYQSAFQTTGSGSNGEGYKALCFGSGSDETNNKTIESLCDYAISQSQNSKYEIVVAYTPVYNGIPGEKPNPSTNADVARQATFKDLFFDTDLPEGVDKDNEDSIKKNKSTFAACSQGVFNNSAWSSAPIGNYTNVATVNCASLPTFYLHNGSNYEVLFDYTNPWDVQMISAMINGVRGTEYKKKFDKAFDKYWKSNDPIYMDTFGNIMMDNLMVVPASVNQHITDTPKINLLNSWVLNGYTSTYSTKQLVEGLRQNVDAVTTSESLIANAGAGRMGGYPAFGESNIGSVGLLYYDSDTIAINDYIHNTSDDVNYGSVLKRLFDLDVNKPEKSDYTLKFEISNNQLSNFNIIDFIASGNVDTPLEGTAVASAMLSNVLEYDKDKQPDIVSELEDYNGTKVKLFSSDAVAVANQLLLPSDDSGKQNAAAIRHLYNFIYQVYKGKITSTTSGSISTSNIEYLLNNSKDSSSFSDGITEGSSSIWEKFKAYNTDFKDQKFPSEFWDYGNNESISDDASRVCIVYPVSETMRCVSQILGLQEGTEFKTYSTMIYATYLNVYGVANKATLSTGTEKTSEFNKRLFDESWDILKYDPSADIDVKTEAEKQKEVMELSYLMLHPEDGRDYRKQLLQNGLSDWLFEQYNRVVYGGLDDTYSGSASKSNSGFLAVETYSDNWLTAWFLNSYADIAVWLIAICSILIIIIGLLKSRKLSWFFVSFLIVINVVLLVPSSGDIVPYITSNFIQNMFTSKMTYWSISQGVANAALEKDAVNKTNSVNNIDDENAAEITKLVKELNVLYTDRSLMVKQDISQKVTQQLSSTYTDIQTLQSARWMLPMIMQQFTGDKGNEENYIYKSLANIWDDMSNMYWYYNPDDATLVHNESPTMTSGNTDATSESRQDKLASIPNVFADYKDTSPKKVGGNNYKNYCYTIHADDNYVPVHKIAYYLPREVGRATLSRKPSLGNSGGKYTDVDSWQSYIDNAVKSSKGQTTWYTDSKNNSGASLRFEDTADSYDRTDRSTVTSDMNYLLHTESPIYYFYDVVKDCIDMNKTVGALIGQLQGEIKENKDGEEVRANFMYSTSTPNGTPETSDTSTINYTGYVRDVLDLEEMFTNMVPYLYQTQLMTGGFDGESGILGDKLISEDYHYYEGTNQSWLYRCNWATKLMENPSYSKPVEVRTSGGDTVTVNNPMLVECYPSNRPMVFSEAQMHAQGLTESDLNLVELKCIKINKDVSKQWTLLINYAGTDGLTKEVLIRQMATDATLRFCDEFSSSGVLNTIYDMYPQSLDLRYISFDSVMKMLMMNVSKNSSYVYGNTMATLINETDIVTAIMLLIVAVICAYVVPFFRIILMALIFYLGFIAILKALFSDPKYKAKVACGQLVSNILFMVYTLGFYAIFSALMYLTSSDDVLTTSSVQMHAGNPVWILLVVIILCVVYVYIMYRQIKFCFTNFRDMGFEVYSMVASGVVGRLSNAIGNIGSSIQGFFSGEERTVSSSSKTDSIKGTGERPKETHNVNVTNNNGTNTNSTINVDASQTREDNREDSIFTDDSYNNMTQSSNDNETFSRTTAHDIDREIETGKKMDNKDTK